MTDPEDEALLAELAGVAGAYHQHTAAAPALRDRRDELIRAALARGVSHRDIAKAAGVHYTRIGQIAATPKKTGLSRDALRAA